MTARKLAVFKFQGDIERGFQIALEIYRSMNAIDPIEKIGELPAPIDLMQAYQQWQTAYRNLGQSSRVLRPKRVELNSFRQRREVCSTTGRILRQEFNKWLRNETFLPIRETWLKHISATDRVSVAIRSQAIEVWQLPWHEWDFWQDYRRLEVTFSPLEREEPASPQTPLPNVLKILVILGEATGINIEADRHAFEQLGAQAEFLTQPKRQALIDALQNQVYDFFCYAGHSHTEDGLGYIDLNPSDSLSLEELYSTFRIAIQNGLRLAIFNSCDGLGLVKALESLQIPYLIVMREPVPDQVAQIFLKNFLEAFSKGAEFQIVAESARKELKKYEDDFPYASWLPLIWQSPLSQSLYWREAVAVPQTNQPTRSLHLRSILRSLRAPIGISLICAAAAIGLRFSGILQPIELQAFDQMMRLRPDEGSDQKITIIEITDADIEMQKQNGEQMQYTSLQGESFEYSLSNQSLIRLLKVLEKYQPRVIGLDLVRDFQVESDSAELKRQFAMLPIVAICQTKNPDDPNAPMIDPPPDISIEQMQKIGFSNLLLDNDRVLRRQVLGLFPQNFDHTSCKTNHSFSAQVAFAYLNQTQTFNDQGNYDDLHLSGKIYPVLRPHVGSYQQIPSDWGGNQILLNYRSSQKLTERFTLAEAFKEPNPRYIQDRIILIGVTAGGKDHHNTPYGVLSGVEIHAHMISQLVNAALNDRPLIQFWSQQKEIIWISGWTIVGGITIWGVIKVRCQRVWILCVGTTTIIFSILSYGCFHFLLLGYWVPFIPVLLAVILASNTILVYNFYLLRRSHRLL